MKNGLILFLFFLLCGSYLSATDYTLSFTVSGESNDYDSIEIKNINQGNTLVIYPNNSLNLNDTVKTEELEVRVKPIVLDDDIAVFPNPLHEESILSINNSVGGETHFLLYRMDGRKILHETLDLMPGINTFSVSIPGGLFILKAFNSGFNKSINIISYNQNHDLQFRFIAHYESTQDPPSETIPKQMLYSEGDRLVFTAKSGNHTLIRSDIINKSTNMHFNFVECKDADGNHYPVVQIGNQLWMAQNLRTTHFNNGDKINTTSPPSLSISAEAMPVYQWAYNGDESLVPDYGRLYTRYAVNDSRILAPPGFRVGSIADWDILTEYVGGFQTAGSLLKNNNWIASSANDAYGFNAEPGGVRTSIITNSPFGAIGHLAFWWYGDDVPENGNTTAFKIENFSDNVARNQPRYAFDGLSVRCMTDCNPDPDILIKTFAIEVDEEGVFRARAEVINKGNNTIINKGLAWGLKPTPVTNDSISNNGSGAGTFEHILTNLKSRSTYYVRAYATTELGTNYGNEQQFQTPKAIPKIPSITNLSALSAIVNSTYNDEGGIKVTELGISINTTGNPSSNDETISSGTVMGDFSVKLTNLSPSTTYYIRAYAKTEIDLVYSDQISFTTLPTEGMIKDVEGNEYRYIVVGNKEWLIDNLRTASYRNGDPIETTANMNEDISNISQPRFQWPAGGNEALAETHGRLYTLDAINDSRGVTPEGWRIPSFDEYNELISFLGGYYIAGNKLKHIGNEFWDNSGVNETEGSVFKIAPAGIRQFDGNFYGLGKRAYVISSSYYTHTANPIWSGIYSLVLRSEDSTAWFAEFQTSNAFSILCIHE